MNSWVSEGSGVIDWVLKYIEKKEENPPVLVLDTMKLYKLELLEDPRKVDGTDEGHVVTVKNAADGREHLLFLQRTLLSKFKEVGAKKGDILAVIIKARHMLLGIDYAVGHWDKSFDGHIRRTRRATKESDKSR